MADLDLHIVAYRWGRKYSPDYVDRLRGGLARHLAQPYQFHLVTDEPGNGDFGIPPEDRSLLQYPGCLARLRLFDPRWQELHGLSGRIVSIDLDVIITMPLDPLFDRTEPFVIFQGANTSNPCPYNGSVFMLRAGSHPEVWWNFSYEAVRRTPIHEFPDDQGWLAWKVPGAAAWKAGPESGIYAFGKNGWPPGTGLPPEARIVAFPGWRDPSKFLHLNWVREHWRA